MTSIEQHTQAAMVMITHHLHPPGTSPIAHNSIQLAEQTAPHGIPDAPNVTKLATGDWNATMANHLNQRMHLCQGMHLPLGHSMGSPDACLGAIDAIDVGEDHSPQYEIVLYSIQANATTVVTTCATVDTKEAPTYNELFIDVINYGTVGDTHPEEIVVDDVHAPRCNEAYTKVQLPASASNREQPHSASRLTPELEVMCCPSMSSNISIQTVSAQLAWIMSAPG